MLPEHIDVKVGDVALRLATMFRDGPRVPLLFLHGFGSKKEDYAPIGSLARFDGRALLAYDAPGFGQSECADLTALSIPFLQKTAESVIARFDLEPFHLVGHSMGGLTALKLAEARPELVSSFTNIEGNLAPEDCFLSRQIIDRAGESEEIFLDRFTARVVRSPDPSSARYAGALRKNVRAGAVAPVFRSMVDLSDGGNLLEIFLTLPMPKMFVHGDQNRSLPYLDALGRSGVRLAEISGSGHFPMYANPQGLSRAIGDFIEGVEASND